MRDPGAREVIVTGRLGGLDTWKPIVPALPRAHRFLEEVTTLELGRELVCRTTLDLDRDPYVRDHVYDAFMQGPEFMIELFHGYTYSGHPVAAAAGLAALDVYESEGIFEQAANLEQPFEEMLHAFADHERVIDVRNCGLMGAVELAPREGAPGARGLEIHKKCFWEENLVMRNGMDILQFSPFLNSDVDDLQQAFEAIRSVIDSAD